VPARRWWAQHEHAMGAWHVGVLVRHPGRRRWQSQIPTETWS
jgi:hypothetical protein